MTRQDDIKQLITNHSRRLQILKEQQALAGLSVEPKILLEIEDIEATIANLQTELKIYIDEQVAVEGDFVMDPQMITALSTTAVGMLIAFLTKAGEATAQKMGEGLYQALKARFEQKPTTQETFSDFEQAPTDGDHQAALRVKLKKLMSEDTDFAEQIKQLVAKAQATEAGKTIINQQAGDNAKQIGQVFGDVNF